MKLNMTREIIKRMQNSERGNSRMQMAIVFIAGMVMTAALAHTPVAADMLSPRPTEEPVVPVAPSTPDSLKPGADLDNGKPVIIELV